MFGFGVIVWLLLAAAWCDAADASVSGTNDHDSVGAFLAGGSFLCGAGHAFWKRNDS